MVSEVNRPGAFTKTTLLRHLYTRTLSPNSIIIKKKRETQKRNNIPPNAKKISETKNKLSKSKHYLVMPESRLLSSDHALHNVKRVPANMFLLHKNIIKSVT